MPSVLPQRDVVLAYIRREVVMRPDHLGQFGPLRMARDLSTAPRDKMDELWFENLLSRCLRVMTEDQRLSVLVACYAGQRCAYGGSRLDEDFRLILQLLEETLRKDLGEDATASMLVGEVFSEASAMAEAEDFPPLCRIVKDYRGLCDVCILDCPRAGGS